MAITGFTDIFVTGATYNNGSAIFTNNSGGAFILSGLTTPFIGGTVTGATNFTNGLTANTISATTYINLPIDVFVTGGTYFNGSATLKNNTGGTFTVTGFYTGSTDVFVTGATYNNGTAVFTNNTGGTFTLLGLTTPFTGGTVSGSTFFTNGLTASTISASTYQNLPIDVFVTGGTYSAGNATFTNNTGGTFTVTGFDSQDLYITGGTFNKNSETLFLVNNTGGTVTITGFTDIFVTGSTYSNGSATFINNTGGTFILTGLTTPFTGGTVGGSTIFTNGLSANTLSATTYQNLPTDVFVTGGTFLGSTITFTNTTGGTFTVTGIISNFTGGTVTGATNFTNGLTANTLTVNGDSRITGNTIVNGSISGSTFISTQSSGDEGGQIDLYFSQTNNTLSGTSITIDSYQNKVRIFESGGSNRGAYIDITSLGTGVSTNLVGITPYKNSTPATVTGSTANTILQSIYIPANTFTAGDLIEVSYRAKKVGANGTCALRLYSNTSLSLSGPVTISTTNFNPANTLYNSVFRTLQVITSNNNTESFNNTTLANTDFANSTSAVTNLTIDWTLDQYLFVAATPVSALDSVTSTYLLLKRIR